jgi:hypothetical protein
MSQYLNYFIGGLDQAVILIVVGVLWCGLAGLGAAATGRCRLAEADAVFGWGIVSFIFTAWGVLTPAPFAPLAWGIFAAAVAAAAYVVGRDGRLFSPGALRAACLALPLLAIAAAMTASQWDEFSHWLPATRFLFVTDHLPGAGNPVTGSAMIPAYPYNWPLLGYLAGRIAGQYVEGAGRLLNVLLLISFGLAAVRLALSAAGKEDKNIRRGWALAALAVLMGTLINPTFAQKVALTAYADLAAAVAVGFAAVLGWNLLGELAAGDGAGARRRAWQFALVMLVLVNVKQVGLVLFVVVSAGVMVTAWRDPAVSIAKFLRFVPVMVVPALILYGLWRYHITSQMSGWPGAEITLKPFADWSFHLIPAILKQMAVVAAKKSLYFVIMLTAVGVALRALFRFDGPFDRLALIVATAFLGYNAFLLLIYVASFGERDALRVVSYWRYNMHGGMLSVAFAAYGLGLLWKRHLAARLLPRQVAWIPLALALVAPLVFAPKLRFDLEPQMPHYRAVALDLAVPRATPLYILDPKGTGAAGVITRYLLDRPEVPWHAAFHDTSLKGVTRFLSDAEPDALIIVHSVTGEVRQALGLDLAPGVSYLVDRDQERWQVIRSWPYPGSGQAD